MIFTQTKLEGSYIIELEKNEDDRGFMARTWDINKFQENNLNTKIVQCNISFSKLKGTIRGMHFQIKPYEESKLIRCTRGKIFDVIIDLRKYSKSYKNWFGVELSDENHKILYVPEGFAHGFQTLENNSEVFYQLSEFYMPNSERGIKFDDKNFQIKWPMPPSNISKKDSSWDYFTDDLI